MQVLEKCLGANVHKEAHASPERGTVEHFFHHQGGSGGVIEVKFSPAFSDDGFQVNPGIQAEIDGCLVLGDSLFPEIGEGVGGIGKILASMGFADRVIGGAVGGRT